MKRLTFIVPAAVGLTAIFVANVAVLGSDLPKTGTPLGRESISQNAWRAAQYCGLNATYVFLRLNRVECEYVDLERELSPYLDGQGLSLAELKKAIGNRGIGARVVQATPEQLMRMQLPVLAHIEKGFSREFEFAARGHYLVVVRVNPQTIQFIDGTTGMLKSTEFSSFISEWSGYLLVGDISEGKSWYYATIASSMLAAGSCWYCLFRRRQLTASFQSRELKY
jgi:hypothetical protein